MGDTVNNWAYVVDAPSEMARRKAALLSGQEKKNLEIWGYPYVFEQFRFHFPLTARMAEGREKEWLHAALIETFGPLLEGQFGGMCNSVMEYSLPRTCGASSAGFGEGHK